MTEDDYGPERSIDSLWQDYLFLTGEMAKTVTRQDMNLFFDLLSQRDKLQGLIECHPGQDEYIHSPAGRSLLTAAQRENQKVRLLLHAGMNRLRSRDKFNRAYEAAGKVPSLGRMDYRK